MAKNKEITDKTIVYFGVACLVIVLILIIPWVTIETEIQCITTPCDPIIEHRSPIGLISTYIQDKKMTSDDPHDDGDACIELYAPVCGQDGRTYSNQCFANANGITVAYSGECESVMIP